jgi:DUF4097 and DUF4098 domain-containing protein YvlB
MATSKRAAQLVLVVALCTLTAAAQADRRKELRYNVGPGASVSVVSPYGPVVVRPSAGRQVVVVAIPQSDKVEVEGTQSGNRVEIRTRMEGKLAASEGAVDFEVHVPQDASVSIRAGNGPVTAERLRGDVMLEGDGASLDVRDLSRGHLKLRTVSGDITLHNVSNSHVEITSIGGSVRMQGVTGAKVTVNTNKGSIHYQGSFGDGGVYSLTNHSGDIEVTLPAAASVSLTARSVTGSVENSYPFKPQEAAATAAVPAGLLRSFTGISQAGSSSVNLQSFSGRIRVKPQ